MCRRTLSNLFIILILSCGNYFTVFENHSKLFALSQITKPAVELKKLKIFDLISNDNVTRFFKNFYNVGLSQMAAEKKLELKKKFTKNPYKVSLPKNDTQGFIYKLKRYTGDVFETRNKIMITATDSSAKMSLVHLLEAESYLIKTQNFDSPSRSLAEKLRLITQMKELSFIDYIYGAVNNIVQDITKRRFPKEFDNPYDVYARVAALFIDFFIVSRRDMTLKTDIETNKRLDHNKSPAVTTGAASSIFSGNPFLQGDIFVFIIAYFQSSRFYETPNQKNQPIYFIGEFLKLSQHERFVEFDKMCMYKSTYTSNKTFENLPRFNQNRKLYNNIPKTVGEIYFREYCLRLEYILIKITKIEARSLELLNSYGANLDPTATSQNADRLFRKFCENDLPTHNRSKGCRFSESILTGIHSNDKQKKELDTHKVELEDAWTFFAFQSGEDEDILNLYTREGSFYKYFGLDFEFDNDKTTIENNGQLKPSKFDRFFKSLMSESNFKFSYMTSKAKEYAEFKKGLIKFIPSTLNVIAPTPKKLVDFPRIRERLFYFINDYTIDNTFTIGYQILAFYKLIIKAHKPGRRFSYMMANINDNIMSQHYYMLPYVYLYNWLSYKDFSSKILRVDMKMSSQVHSYRNYNLLRRVKLATLRKNTMSKLIDTLIHEMDQNVYKLLDKEAFEYVGHINDMLHIHQLQEIEKIGSSSSKSFIKKLESQMRDWSNEGIPKEMADKFNKDHSLKEEDIHTLRFTQLKIPPIQDWRSSMINIIRSSYNELFNKQPFKSIMKDKHFINPQIQLMKDTHENFETKLGEYSILITEFPMQQRRPKSFIKRHSYLVKSKLVNTIISGNSLGDGSWYIVNLNINHIIRIFKELRKIFIKHRKAFVNKAYLRTAFLAVIGSIQSQYINYHRHPASVPPIVNNFNIDPNYHLYDKEKRYKEYTESMIASQLMNTWAYLFNLIIPSFLNTNRMSKLDNNFSTKAWAQSLSDPLSVNSLRMFLKSDIAFKYLDHFIPNSFKDSMKSIRHGKGVWFTYALLTGGLINTHMGFKGAGMTMTAQAPLFGSVILDFEEWHEKQIRMGTILMTYMGANSALVSLQLMQMISYAYDAGEISKAMTDNAIVQECLTCGQLCICEEPITSEPKVKDIRVSAVGIAMLDMSKLILSFGVLPLIASGVFHWLAVYKGLLMRIKNFSRLDYIVRTNVVSKMLRYAKKSKLGNWLNSKNNKRLLDSEIRLLISKAKAGNSDITDNTNTNDQPSTSGTQTKKRKYTERSSNDTESSYNKVHPRYLHNYRINNSEISSKKNNIKSKLNLNHNQNVFDQMESHNINNNEWPTGSIAKSKPIDIIDPNKLSAYPRPGAKWFKFIPESTTPRSSSFEGVSYPRRLPPNPPETKYVTKSPTMNQHTFPQSTSSLIAHTGESYISGSTDFESEPFSESDISYTDLDTSSVPPRNYDIHSDYKDTTQLLSKSLDSMKNKPKYKIAKPKRMDIPKYTRNIYKRIKNKIPPKHTYTKSRSSPKTSSTDDSHTSNPIQSLSYSKGSIQPQQFIPKEK